MSHRHEINSILKQVQARPREDREALAKELLQSAESVPASPPPRDTLSLARAVVASMTRPPPSDDEVKQWIHEHRATNYGGGMR